MMQPTKVNTQYSCFISCSLYSNFCVESAWSVPARALACFPRDLPGKHKRHLRARASPQCASPPIACQCSSFWLRPLLSDWSFLRPSASRKSTFTLVVCEQIFWAKEQLGVLFFSFPTEKCTWWAPPSRFGLFWRWFAELRWGGNRTRPRISAAFFAQGAPPGASAFTARASLTRRPTFR